MMQLCFATNNNHKIEEVAALLGGHFNLLGLHDIGCNVELAEDFFTLEENSRQKAEFVFNNFNVACLADDTGLEVEALNGEPGVFSASYAGPQRNSQDNTELLLVKLAKFQNRKAQFRTVITYFETKNLVTQFEGIVKGEILHQPKGTEGFGYDPVFRPEGFSKTLAEMTLLEKNQISHRGTAIQKLVKFLSQKQFH
jgi:XTP/dITP diphosphohydrolase